MKKTILSIVILNYNTKDLLENCLESLSRVKNEVSFEIVVVDNGSTDDSIDFIENYSHEFSKTPKGSSKLSLKLVRNRTNLGFAAGNNKARDYCKGKYVLFLNSDTIVRKNVLRKTTGFLEKNEDVAAVTCKVVLPDGSLDKDTRRAFITPWIGFTHLFIKLDRIFPKSRIFSEYWYGYLSDKKTHDVDAIQGAFFLTRLNVLDKVSWFDEDYFLDGEDIDLCWKIKELGMRIVYYPKVSILHLKGATKGKTSRLKIPFSQKLKYRMAGVDSMEIFVKKRLWGKYPHLLLWFVIIGIKTLKFFRFIKTLLLG